MLSKADEYPIHQTPDPIRVMWTGDPRAYERYWMVCHDPAGEVLDFMRKLTGEAAIRKADSYASMYLPGHFLTTHDDRHDKHDRVAAYVFSMNKVWEKDWGGHLAFFDDNGNINDAFIPSFNTLNMFLIPQWHSVQLVTPFAAANRTSYLGWLHR